MLAPLRSLTKPEADMVRPMMYWEAQKMLDWLWPHGLHSYWKSSFMEDLSDGAIETIMAHSNNKPSPLSMIAMMYHHGVATRYSPEKTAFAHRDKMYNLNVQTQWREARDTEKNMQWIRKFWHDIEPHVSNRVYVNFLSQEGEDRVKAAYGNNYTRLASLKRKYDPNNLFRLNQNVKPV